MVRTESTLPVRAIGAVCGAHTVYWVCSNGDECAVGDFAQNSARKSTQVNASTTYFPAPQAAAQYLFQKINED